jgi:hypothetical protein
MGEARLVEAESAIAGADGRATVQLGPSRAFEDWTLESVAVFSNSVLQSQARVYRDSEAPSRFLGGTYDGNNDSAVAKTFLSTGQSVVVVWSGCTVGAQCTVTLNGLRRW